MLDDSNPSSLNHSASHKDGKRQQAIAGDDLNQLLKRKAGQPPKTFFSAKDTRHTLVLGLRIVQLLSSGY